jgi:hypothetical protein
VKAELVFEYPVWFIILCIALGLGYAWILYKSKKQKEIEGVLYKVLFAFRALSVAIIAFLLLAPLLRTISRTLEKPVIVFLQDNSLSVLQNRDSSFYKNEYPGLVDNFLASLNENFDTRIYHFGNNIKDNDTLNFREKQTDIDFALREVINLYANRNVGAFVLASDGIYNKGANPFYSAGMAKVPIYTIALGDTTVEKDLLIGKVSHNKIAFLNNSFPVEIRVDARKLAGSNTVLKVLKGNDIVFTKAISIDKNDFQESISLQLEANQPGLQRYIVTVTEVSGEFTIKNNVRDFYIDVIDSRQKILILAEAPHPDIAAIRQAIESNQNYEVEVAIASSFNKSLKAYGLVILHQLPSGKNNAARFLDEIKTASIPFFSILGLQSNVMSFGNMGSGINVSGLRGNLSSDFQAKFNPSFGLFTISDELRRSLNNFPPLSAPYAQYRLTGNANVMLYQKIGQVETDSPLLLFMESDVQRSAIMVGEGMWRWRMQNFAEFQHHNQFNELISKIIQYLTAKSDKSNLKVNVANSFFENDPILFEAEVYNESYEPINDPDVLLELTNDEGKTFNYTFSKAGKGYRLNAGLFPAGDYRYTSSVNLSGKKTEIRGGFTVKPVFVELLNTTADHALLYNISKASDAEMFLPKDLMQLVDVIKAKEDIKPISFSESRLREMINLRWIFFLILSLLSVEWFIRKRNGSY